VHDHQQAPILLERFLQTLIEGGAVRQVGQQVDLPR